MNKIKTKTYIGNLTENVMTGDVSPASTNIYSSDKTIRPMAMAASLPAGLAISGY